MTINISKTLNSIVPSDAGRDIKKDSLAYRRRAERAERAERRLAQENADLLIEVARLRELVAEAAIETVILEEENEFIVSLNEALSLENETLRANNEKARADADLQVSIMDEDGQYWRSELAQMRDHRDALQDLLTSARGDLDVALSTIEGLRLINASLNDQYRQLDREATEFAETMNKDLEAERQNTANVLYDLVGEPEWPLAQYLNTGSNPCNEVEVARIDRSTFKFPVITYPNFKKR